MGDIITCIGLRYGLIPVAFLSLLTTAYLFYKYRTEADLIHKDIIADRVKYAAIITALLIIAIPLVDYAFSSDLLATGCSQGVLLPGQETCYVSREFANGTNITIVFPVHGGSNTDTAIDLPRDARVKNISFILEYSENGSWKDEFNNWSRIADSSAIDVDEINGYAYIKMKRLIVNSTTVLGGTQIFDEVYIKSGGTLTTDIGQKLYLKINGPLTIEEGGEIKVDGKGDSELIKEPSKQRKGLIYGSGGGAGGYGGTGGKGGDDEKEKGGDGSSSWGSVESPFDLGMAGANGGGADGLAGSGSPGTGSLGGGAVKIEAKEVIVNGLITANGLDGKDATIIEGTGGGGAGSGGSIMLTADSLTVNGKITANGGIGGGDNGDDASGGGGGGGRIALFYKTISGENNVFATGSKGGRAKAGKQGSEGGKGTVYEKQEGEAVKTQLITGYLVSSEINPDNLKCWKTFQAKSTTPPGSEIRFSVLNASNNETLCIISTNGSAKEYDISQCTSCAESISLKAEFVSISVAKTPLLYNWKVSYDLEVKNLSVDLGSDLKEVYSTSALSGRVVLSDETTEPNITAETAMYINDCKCVGCLAKENNCSVKITFEALSSGKITLENPSFSYCSGG